MTKSPIGDENNKYYMHLFSKFASINNKSPDRGRKQFFKFFLVCSSLAGINNKIPDRGRFYIKSNKKEGVVV